MCYYCVFFFFKQKTAYEMRISDWSSDVCSSDLRLVEIGCIELIDRRESGRTFHAYFHPERDMPAEAEAVHGLSIQFLSDKPLFASCIDDLLAFLGDAAMVAHNAAFDFGFVNAELARAGRPALDMVRMCCRPEEHPSELQSLMRNSYAVF